MGKELGVAVGKGNVVLFDPGLVTTVPELLSFLEKASAHLESCFHREEKRRQE